MLREFGATDQLGCAEQVQLETRRWPNNCEMRPMVVVDPSGGGGGVGGPHVLSRRGAGACRLGRAGGVIKGSN